MKFYIKVLNIKDNSDGSATITFEHDKLFSDFVKLYYKKKKTTKKLISKFILEAITKFVEEKK